MTALEIFPPTSFSEIILTTVILVFSFCSSFFLTKKWIKLAEDVKLLGKDMNKYEKPLISRSGGVAVGLAICFSLLMYIFLKIFYWKTTTHLIEAFAISSTISWPEANSLITPPCFNNARSKALSTSCLGGILNCFNISLS